MNVHEASCSNCDKMSPYLYDVTFKNIVESYEKGLIDNTFTVMPEEYLKKIEER
jgi:hypothetical protein